jgi:uncharacterized membrane protein YgcG
MEGGFVIARGRRPFGSRRRMTSLQLRCVLTVLACLAGTVVAAAAQGELPALADRPVNDLANVIDGTHAAAIEAICRELKQKSGDTVFVVTVKTIAPWSDIREYAVKLFEKQGLGERGKDNGLLVLLAVEERRVWVEVGYGLEPYITDGFAGETSRQVMTPFFRQGDYGGGLEAGVARLVGRIAEARSIEITGAPPPSRPAARAVAPAERAVPADPAGVHDGPLAVFDQPVRQPSRPVGTPHRLERLEQRRGSVRRRRIRRRVRRVRRRWRWWRLRWIRRRPQRRRRRRRFVVR